MKLTSITIFQSIGGAFSSLYSWAIDNLILFIILAGLLIYILIKFKKIFKTTIGLLLIPIDAIRELFQRFRNKARVLSPFVLFEKEQDLCFCFFCQKGGGKSSTEAALTCWEEQFIVEPNIIDFRNKIKTIMYDFSYFEQIDIELKKLANEAIEISEQMRDVPTEEIPEDVYAKFKPSALVKQLEHYYLDYVKGKFWKEYSEYSYKFMMEQYIERSFSYHKKCYVYSYTEYISNYTGHRNYQIGTNALQIKDRFKNKDYISSSDAIFNYGDITSSESSNNKFWQNNVSGGMDLALRVWRQLTKQTTIFNCDCQEFMTLDPSQRRLIDVPVEILKVTDVKTHPVGRKINNTINDINEYIEKLKRLFTRKPSNLDSIYTRVKKHCLAKEYAYKCDDWKKTTICIYPSYKEAEKGNLCGKVCNIFLRIEDAYGQYDTYEFSALQDVLIEESTAVPVFSNPKETYEQKKLFAAQYLDPNGTVEDAPTKNNSKKLLKIK